MPEAAHAARAGPERKAGRAAPAPKAEGRAPLPSRPGPAATGLAFLDASVGLPLAGSDRAAWERRLGTGLDGVSLHTDGAAATAADALGADAFARGDHLYFGAGRYRPGDPAGIRLIAHELAHVVQQRSGGAPASTTSLEHAADRSAADVAAGRRTRVRGAARPGSIQLQARRTPAPVEIDPWTRLTRNVERMRTQALPAFQQALDAVDEAGVREAGLRILTLWAPIEGAHAELRPPDGPDRPEYVEIRKAVLAGVTPQTFRGAGVAGPPRPVEHPGDTGAYIADQTETTATTVKDAGAVQVFLAKQRVPYEDQETVVRLLAAHPNPWQLGYILAVVRAAGLEPMFETFGFDTHDDMQAILASYAFTLKREFVGPGDRIGLLEPVAGMQKVRVLRPYGARELALELYGDYSFYEAVLQPYNRGALGRVRPEGLVPAGTELLIEGRLARGRYRLAFMQVERTKRALDRPYIEAGQPGGLIAGTKGTYTVHWPVPPEPEGWKLSTGVSLWRPATSLFEWAILDWSVENDPATVSEKGVAAEETLESQTVRMETLTQAGSSVDHEWPELGTHVVRCKVMFGYASLPTEVMLRYAQPVVTEKEKAEAEWLGVADPRIQPEQLSLEAPQQFAETYGDFQKAVAELGVTEEELAENPHLAARIGTQYYPEFLLRDLRKQRDATADERKKKKLGWQIDALEQAIERTKSSPMRPVTALWVSSTKDRTLSMRPMLYVAPDAEAPRAYPWPLRLWDFTLEGQSREYTDGHGASTPAESLHGLLVQFADEVPYPDGTLRILVEPLLLPKEWGNIARDTLELHTHGGSRLERFAPAIMTVCLLVIGFATLQPEVVIVAFAVYGAYQGLADIVTRLEEGTFEWDLQTGMDILAIAGGITAVASPVISAVRGFGEVAWLGTSARAVGVIQLGVMVGTHSKEIIEAHRSGDADKIADAWLSAAIDGAIVAVTHKGSKGMGEEERIGSGRERALEEAGRVTSEPGGGAAGEGRASTAVGIGGEKPPAPPPGQEPVAAPRKGTPRAVHEEWAAGVSERGLKPRAVAGEPAGAPVGRGTYESVRGERTFATPEAAFAAYDEALTRAGGREVGIYRNAASPTGEYIVRVGDEHSVSPPYEGKWETVLHRHPNPENVLTRRMPAPQDVHNTLVDAVRNGRPMTEFIDYPLPDGRHGLVAYTVEPAQGRVTIKYELTDGTTVTRTFSSVEAYASHYSERTTYVDPKSPEYSWMMQDLHDFYSKAPYERGSTATGVLKPDAPTEAPAKPPAVEGKIEHRGETQAARESARVARSVELRERAMREAAADPAAQRGLDNLAKMFNAAKGDEILAAAPPEQLGALLRALADPDVVSFKRPAFYQELARRPQALEFAQRFGAKAVRNLALKYGWGDTLVQDVLPRATAKLEQAATPADRASILDSLSSSAIDRVKLDALLGKEAPPKPPRPVKPTKANMGVDRNLKSWKAFYESEEREAVAHGETVDSEVIKRRADVLQILDRAKQGAFKNLTPASRTEIVDRFDQLAQQSGMPRHRINPLRGNLSEWLRRTTPGEKKVGWLAQEQVPPNRSGATVPDDAITHDEYTEWLEQKSDEINRGTTTKSGAYTSGVAAARRYLVDARLDLPNLPAGDKLSIDFIHDPGAVTRDEMLRILLSDETVFRVRFGSTWYDRASVK